MDEARGIPVIERTGPRLLAAPASHRARGMSLGEPLRVAYHGLAANKLRSFLTMLGVIIGVAAVIVMVALGQGVAEATKEQIRKLGTNRLYIRAEETERGGVRMGADSGVTLKLEDVDLLKKRCRYLVAAAPEVRSDVQAKHGNQNTRTTVVGSTQDYFPVRSLTIEEGRAFNDGEIERRARVAVLGADVRDELFGGATAIGRTVKVNGQSFAVVGVTKRVGSTMYGNRDDQITVPVTTAMKRLFRVDYIRSISAQAVSEERMRDAEEEVHAVIRESRRLSDDEPSPVRIHNQADLTESASEQSTFLTMLLGGIAVVSLVVGGIGIMNIMLVSVTERTREIGIRKAIGAKRRDVLYQFLLESVTLSLAGGALGVALGIGVATWFGRPESEGGLGYPMLLDMAPIVVSFGFSAFVGVFFGIYPAIKASALDPIEALRYE